MSRLARERAAKEAKESSKPKPIIGDSSYDPLSLAKTNRDETAPAERKVVSRHLGGERDAASSSKKSGNYQRLGKRVTTADGGEQNAGDPTRSDVGGFLSGGSSRYDPLQLIRAHTSGGGDGTAAAVAAEMLPPPAKID